jgi:phosphate transport system substrate-binding protein
MSRLLVASAALAAIAVSPAFAQDLNSLPEYRPAQTVTGTIRALGNYHMGTLMQYWEEGFRKFHPGIRFEDKMLGTANAIAGLYLETADLALMGREVMPMESVAHRRVFRHDPLDIAVATASYNVPLETFAFAIFVNKSNPISRLTLKQVDAIFGCDRKLGAPKSVATWGDIGLSGEWASRPVHLYGYETNTGLGYFFSQKALGGSHKWNCNLREYANLYAEDGKLISNAGDLMMRDLADDPGGIAFCGFGHKTANVKALPMASHDDGPYIELTKANVANRTYPLTRTVYIFIERDPARPVEPKVREFLQYVLSKQGQQDVARQDVYLPLTPDFVQQQLHKLK